MPEPEEQKQEDLYKVTRGQIEHIDNTLSQRTIWLIISQSFFVSGYAVLITGNPNDAGMLAKQHFLIMLFPIASIILILVSLFDIIAGILYLRSLRISYHEASDKNIPEPGYPPLEGFKMLNALKNLSPLIVPFVFVAVWLIILFKH